MLSLRHFIQTYNPQGDFLLLAVERPSHIIPEKPFKTLKKCNVARRRNLFTRLEVGTERRHAEQSWRITHRALRNRVRNPRAELELYRDQLEGVPFDIPSGDFCTPNSLDNFERHYIVYLVEEGSGT